MKLTVAGKPVSVSAKNAIGKGGEANVYALDAGTALKVFKLPTDPDYANDPVAQEGARRRIAEQQLKLPAFPSGLPTSVVTPRELAYNGKGIAGYTMSYLPGYEVLLRYSDRRFREQGGVDPNSILGLFDNLAAMVRAIHQRNVVVGDFNDLNVLVDGNRDVYGIDADSFQFGQFLCHTFTSRFLDPLASDPHRLTPVRQLNRLSDWYAYAVMLFQSLLYVGPYGGVHRPKLPRGPRLQHDQRVLQRITVFDPDVVYPKPALPYSLLPDDLLDYFHGVFERDERGEFPVALLAGTRWTTCASCGTEHARPVCPACATYVKKEPVLVRGNVKARRVFLTEGQIVASAYQGGKLRYLYHDGSHFRREDDGVVAPGLLHPQLRYRICGDRTAIAIRHRVLVFPEKPAMAPVDAYGHVPQIDANSTRLYWIEANGQLRSIGAREDTFRAKHIGDVLTGRTLFWVGERFGLGFYRAGELTRAFVFTDRGLDDQVQLPDFRGELVDTTCAFSEERAWFFATLQLNGALRNHVYVVDPSGKTLGYQIVEQTENHWLAAGIRGRFAAGRSLYVPTDEGIVRVDEDDLSQPGRAFPDTEPFVDGTSYLLAGDGGIYVVGTQEIKLLIIS